jgi:transposase
MSVMMKGLTLSQREETRVQVLNKVLEGKLRLREAAKLLGISERHGWRILGAYRRDGPAAVAHGNRGRRPANAFPKEVKARILELAQGRYQETNHCHLTELLQEREGLSVCRSSVRRLLTAAGLKSSRQRRPPQHRVRRERYPQEGMLLQIDGSHHDWLEGRGPYLTLVAAIDDATGTVPSGVFREQEDAQGYFLLLQEVIQRQGIPLALYSDRHSIFSINPKQRESLEEQLAGERQPTQFGRALKELGIEPIFARSPQAKGRIERLWGTLQDRLRVELRLAGALTLEKANQVLGDFLPQFNARFAVPPAQSGLAYRELPQDLALEGVLCFKYQRTVARDNTVHFEGQTLQLLPGLDRLSYARARVEVQERLDGSLAVSYQGKTIASKGAPPGPVTLRARKGARDTTSPQDLEGMQGTPSNGHSEARADLGRGHLLLPKKTATKPGPDHPWRRPVLTKSLNT